MLQSTIDYHTDLQRNRVGPGAARIASAIPDDARAVIEREPRSATRSAPGRRGWRLRFQPRQAPGVDPFTGWTSGSDPLTHVVLRFPDLSSAVRYAEHHDLSYDALEETPRRRSVSGSQRFAQQSPMRLCCWPTGPHALCCGRYPIIFGGEDARSPQS